MSVFRSLSALLLFCALPSLAQDMDGGVASEDAAAAAAVPDVPDAGVPAELTTVVTARRAVSSASEHTVRRDVLQAAPRSSATDLLRLVPGLVASQHSGDGKAQQLFLRGFDALHGQDVELVVAGIPVNQVSHLHALGYADANFLIPEAIRELRVTEGSYRGFQGDFAVAGTVRFELGLEEPGVFALVQAGQFGRRRLVFGLAAPENTSTFAAVELGESTGFGPQRASARASTLMQAVVPLSGGVRLTAVGGSYFGRFESPGVVLMEDVTSGAADFFAAPLAQQGGSVGRHQLRLAAELPAGEGVLSVELYGVLATSRLRNNFTGFLNDARGDGLEQLHDVGTMGGQARYGFVSTAVPFPLRLDLAVGARTDRALQLQRSVRDVDGTYFDTSIDAEVVQLDAFGWLEASSEIGPWRFSLGGRADGLGFEVFDRLAFEDPRYYDGQGYRRSAFGVHLGLKASVQRQLGPDWTLFLNYGDGFRSPQARSLAEGERTPFVSVHGGELGASFSPGRWLALQGALFGSWVADDLFFDHTVGTTTFVGPTVRAGLQLSGVTRPLPGLTAALSATVAHAASPRTGFLLPYFAPLVGRADVGWKRALGALEWELGGGLTALGPRPLPFGDYSLPVVLLDLRAGLHLGPLGLALELQNALDARWRDGEFVYPSRLDPARPASLVPARHFTAGSPRTASLSLELQL